MTRRSVATAVIVGALLTSCGEAKDGVSVVSFNQYADMPLCWFRESEDLNAFLAVADNGSEGVPWLISSKCIAKGDLPSFGAGTLYSLGPPYIVDPTGLLRKHVAANMAFDNVRTDLPLPSSGSPVYYIVARLKPLPDHPQHYEIIDIKRAAPTGVTFERFLEMGPTQRSELLTKMR